MNSQGTAAAKQKTKMTCTADVSHLDQDMVTSPDMGLELVDAMWTVQLNAVQLPSRIEPLKPCLSGSLQPEAL